MGPRTQRRFVRPLEVLVVVSVLAILALILTPVFHKSRDHTLRNSCLNNIHSLATAVRMYVQDHQSRFPGKVPGEQGKSSWEDALLTYVGSKRAFCCPADPLVKKMQAPVSYGYNGLLVRLDGSGLNEGNGGMPKNTGAICDASPTREWGQGGLVGGGAWGDETLTVQPAPRHQGVVIGYCDGHVDFEPNQCDVKNLQDRVSRAFFQANAFGIIDNPAGGLHKIDIRGVHPDPTEITSGGDYVLYPLLTAAAEVWKYTGNIQYYSRGFLGQGYTTGRPKSVAGQEDWVWGFGNDTDPWGGTPIPLAKDCVVIIVAKKTKIKNPLTGQPFLGDPQKSPFRNSTYVCITADINVFFTAANGMTGYSANAWQTYTYNTDSGTRKFFARMMGLSPRGSPGDHNEKTGYHDVISGICPDRWQLTFPGHKPATVGGRKLEAVIVENDADMVDRVAADPYGIGYCSSIFADLDRVQVLGLKNPTTGQEYYFPNADPKHRWEVGDDAPTPAQWPMVRTLYAVVGGKAERDGKFTTFADFFLTPGSKGRQCLLRGPLFTASYWRLGVNDR
jgi:hypothetical protein